MKRRAGLLALLLLSMLPLALADTGDVAPPEGLKGRLEVREGIPVLHLLEGGTPREHGFAHGWLLAKEILDGADKSLSSFFGDRLPMVEVLVLPLVRRAFVFSEDEMDELKGILEGLEARLPDAADRKLESLGRTAKLDDLLLLNVFGDIYTLGCSSLAVWGPRTVDGQTLVARNFDFPALDLVVSKQHVRIVAKRGDARAYVGISYPGCIGVLTALNEDGVFAAIHDVPVAPGLKDLAEKNVPRLVAIRRLVEQLPAEGAVEKATALCRGWNTLYGNNFMIATPDADHGLPAGVLEYDTREADDQGVDLRAAGKGRDFVLCTNHHRVRGEASDCWRYDLLEAACTEDDAVPLTVEALFQLAGRAAFPAKGETIREMELGTLHEVVAETRTRRLHVRMADVGENIRTKKAVVFEVR